MVTTDAARGAPRRARSLLRRVTARPRTLAALREGMPRNASTGLVHQDDDGREVVGGAADAGGRELAARGGQACGGADPGGQDPGPLVQACFARLPVGLRLNRLG